MAKAKVVDPQVQAWYDALPDDEKTAFNNKLIELNRSLSDMRWSVSTKGLDKRMLFPKVVIPNHQTAPELFDDEGDDAQRKRGKEASKRKTAGVTVELGDKLPEGVDLAKYIKDQLGDGKALADFYLKIITLTAAESRASGIYPNHKLMAAQWLAERGWGKVGTDGGEKAPTTINVINYGEAPTQPAPMSVIQIETDKLATAEEDAGKDKPRDEFDNAARSTFEDIKPIEALRKEVEIEGDLDFLRNDNAEG